MSGQICNATSATYEAILSHLQNHSFATLDAQRYGSIQSMGESMELTLSEATAAFGPTVSVPQVELSARFGHLIQRHLGVAQLAQALTHALAVPGVTQDLSESWTRIDFESIKNHCALCGCLFKIRSTLR